MKYILFLCLPIFLCFQDHKLNLSKGLVASYSFNQCDARDDSGHESNGKMWGEIACRCGVEGSGLLLDGIDDYIEFEGLVNKTFNTTDFTIGFYIKPLGYSTFDQSMLSKRALCDDNYMMDIRLDLNQQTILADVYQSEYKYHKDLSPKFESGPWYHFVLVREGSIARTYINGVLQKESHRCSGVDITNDALLSFSNSPCIKGGRTQRFKGVLDQLTIYDIPLSHKAVLKLYQQFPVERAEVDCVS